MNARGQPALIAISRPRANSWLRSNNANVLEHAKVLESDARDKTAKANAAQREADRKQAEAAAAGQAGGGPA